MKKLCIITGVSGYLGSALSNAFLDVGYNVFGIDIVEPTNLNNIEYYHADLNLIVDNQREREYLFGAINTWKAESDINVLINNAAFQFVSTQHPVEIDKFKQSLNVNLIAPYILTTYLSDDLEKTKGSVINISSIHARLTKPGFSLYAASKAALSMLTKSLAIDYGSKFRINCIEPAAIDTPMLRDGFDNDESKMEMLKSYHPQNKIAMPKEVAELALKISNTDIDFLHGSCIDMSGAISSRLHDPA
jgi:NAD(P)-dependent dehydrogenase (short-subunit alcohol dehydrogenase family)